MSKLKYKYMRDRKVRIGFSITPYDLSQLRYYAYREQLSTTDFIRFAIWKLISEISDTESSNDA